VRIFVVFHNLTVSAFRCLNFLYRLHSANCVLFHHRGHRGHRGKASGYRPQEKMKNKKRKKNKGFFNHRVRLCCKLFFLSSVSLCVLCGKEFFLSSVRLCVLCGETIHFFSTRISASHKCKQQQHRERGAPGQGFQSGGGYCAGTGSPANEGEGAEVVGDIFYHRGHRGARRKDFWRRSRLKSVLSVKSVPEKIFRSLPVHLAWPREMPFHRARHGTDSSKHFFTGRRCDHPVAANRMTLPASSRGAKERQMGGRMAPKPARPCAYPVAGGSAP
jgi:hypothetical protein